MRHRYQRACLRSRPGSRYRLEVAAYRIAAWDEPILSFQLSTISHLALVRFALPVRPECRSAETFWRLPEETPMCPLWKPKVFLDDRRKLPEEASTGNPNPFLLSSTHSFPAAAIRCLSLPKLFPPDPAQGPEQVHLADH